jgi:hypothetical protein
MYGILKWWYCSTEAKHFVFFMTYKLAQLITELIIAVKKLNSTSLYREKMEVYVSP